jgi:hypothetical protein
MLRTVGVQLAFLVVFMARLEGQEVTEPLNLGDDWFNRLRAPETRTVALREWDEARRVREKENIPEEEDTLEYFSALHRDIQVVKAPQPGQHEAWLVWWLNDYSAAREVLEGPDPDKYPPASAPSGIHRTDTAPWRPGEPWLESAGAFLTNEQGRIFSGVNYLGLGVIADADGDGLLDWVDLSTISLEKQVSGNAKRSPPEYQADLVSIGPIDSDAPRTTAWIWNLRPYGPRVARSFLFDIRSRTDGAGIDLVAVRAYPSAPGEPAEIVMNGREAPVPAAEVVALGPGNVHDTATSFAEQKFGWTKASVGWGSGAVDEMKAGEPTRASLDGPRRDFVVPPGIAALAPDQAALALVDHNRDDSHRERFDLVIERPLPKAPETGWVEVVVEPGWEDSSLTVWWLKANDAECWVFEPKDGAFSFAVSKVAREPLVRWIAILSHLDRVRSVARHAAYDELDHDRFGGDDHTIITVRAGVVKLAPLLAAFDPGVPTLWNAIRGPVDRPLTGVLAAVLGNAPPGWDGDISTFERHDLTEAAASLLRPEIIDTVPPPLARQVIRLIGLQERENERGRLNALLDRWGEPDAAEMALTKARKEHRIASHRVWEPSAGFADGKWRRLHLAINRLRDLEAEQVNDTSAQLRESILQTLRMFDVGDDPAKLETWSKEVGDAGASWAMERLAQLKGSQPP